MELTIEQMAQRLVQAQNDMQKAVEKAREEERAKVEEEKNTEIQSLNNQLEVANSNVDLLTSEKKELKRQLKLIEVKVEDKINDGIKEKIAQLDYAPEIVNVCNKIDETIGGQVSKLNGIYEALGGNFDDISKQRLYSMLINLESNVELVKKFIGIVTEESNIQLDDPEEIIQEGEEEIDRIDTNTSDNTVGLSMNF
ncbi:hypothetical protein [Clostridium felsineum]|uniref:Uncharacterized protein n=1 Tax=Clostridium felsineum TaxID=36839 RepID=A0A1S8LWQ3_9CLOT|nr:hypothetical protein [Clostridium felsineum]URZ05914.1 hypothetical protein CLROS_012460 [Clostridium felsineum]URZ10951.1 hypothetical protein CROST_016670 [Clostridium felsineum]